MLKTNDENQQIFCGGRLGDFFKQPKTKEININSLIKKYESLSQPNLISMMSHRVLKA